MCNQKQYDNLYGNSEQAVIVEKDGKIEYFNDIAAHLIPDISSASPEDIFPPEILCHPADRFLAEAPFAGINMVINITRLGDCRVFGIINPNPQDRGDWTNIFRAISYEMNNYLSVLKMSSGLLLPSIENMENPKLKKYASMINHSYYNLRRIADNINDFGHIIRNSMTLNRTSFDIAAACRSLIDSVRHLVNRGVTLTFEADCDSLSVYADREKLEKLILNLLSNSYLYTPEGGSIIFSIVSTEDRFILTVSDNGQGISPDVLQNVWCQYRTDRKIEDNRSGVGLGLPVAHAIANSHGGSVMLESKPGQGTSVTVSIPMVQPEAVSFKDSVAEYDQYNTQQLLTELSDIINSEMYSQRYMD